MLLKGLFSIVTSALFFTALPAKSAESCDMYFVQKGDTLRLIAEQYYGTRALSSLIYAANTDTVGADPNTIEIGMALDIPCRAGMNLPVATSFINIDHSAAPQTGQFLARSAAYPFVDDNNTGLITRILFAALRRGGFNAPLTTVRPENTSTLLRTATTPESLLSFPWIKPDCAAGMRLSPEIADICANYRFSNPLYEITLGLFTTADGDLGRAPTLKMLESRHICFAEFYDNTLLDSIGLNRNAALGIAPAGRNSECVSGLLDGTYDVIVSDYQSIAALPLAQSSRLTDLPAYARKSTLHAAAYRANPAAEKALELVNRGLVEILASGEWFDIVNQSLALTNGS